MTTPPKKVSIKPLTWIALFAVRQTAEISVLAILAVLPVALLWANMDLLTYLEKAMEITKLLFIPVWLIHATVGLLFYLTTKPQAARPAESDGAGQEHQA